MQWRLVFLLLPLSSSLLAGTTIAAVAWDETG
jgi:hypothetical protein